MTTTDTSTPINPATLNRAELLKCCQPSTVPAWRYRLQLQQRYGDLAEIFERRYEQSVRSHRRNRKFSDAQIRDIRRLAATLPRKMIAEQFGTTPSMISAIMRNTVYRDVVSVSKRKVA